MQKFSGHSYKGRIAWSSLRQPSFLVYRAMQYSVKRGLAIACMSSVCRSICLWRWWIQDHTSDISWKSWTNKSRLKCREKRNVGVWKDSAIFGYPVLSQELLFSNFVCTFIGSEQKPIKNFRKSIATWLIVRDSRKFSGHGAPISLRQLSFLFCIECSKTQII